MNLTCVSGYWPVKNKHGDKYLRWFKNSLKIQCPYVFFGNKESIEIIKPFRKDIPTYYIECEIKDFYTYKFKKKIITHPIHCPSKELNLIWNEKIFLIQKASKLNPFNTDYFKWTDAGIFVYRDAPPPNKPLVNEEKLNKFPKDKVIFSSSNNFCEYEKISKTNHYHYISGEIMMHRNIVDEMTEIYKKYINELMSEDNIWTDQVIWTHIYKDHPNLFYKLWYGNDYGYGAIIKYLYATPIELYTKPLIIYYRNSKPYQFIRNSKLYQFIKKLKRNFKFY